MTRTVLIAQLDGGLLPVPAQPVADGESMPALVWLTSVVEFPDLEAHLLIQHAVTDDQLARLGIPRGKVTLHRVADTDEAEFESQALVVEAVRRAELLHGPVSVLWVAPSTSLSRRFCSSVRRELGDTVSTFFHSTRPRVGLSESEIDDVSDLIKMLTRSSSPLSR